MLVLTKRLAQTIWGCAKAHLAERTDMSKVQLHLAGESNLPLESLGDAYRRLLLSLQNRQGMMNAIGGTKPVKGVLFGFDPVKTQEHYTGDWRLLFRRVQHDVRPRSRMAINNPLNYWVVFCKGALDGAAYLSQFPDLNSFARFVNRFATSALAAPGLPMILSHEIHGFGFALACDFLKESGWSQYAKPDIHTMRILRGLGVSDGSAYLTFKTMVRMAEMVGEEPYTVDNVLWLIGSGNLHELGETFQTNRAEFIRATSKRLKELA